MQLLKEILSHCANLQFFFQFGANSFWQSANRICQYYQADVNGKVWINLFISILFFSFYLTSFFFNICSLTDQGSFDVRFCAVKATVNYLLVHEKDTNILNHFKDLLGPVLSITMESIEKGDDDAGLKALIDLAESCPKFLRPQLDQLFIACIKVFYLPKNLKYSDFFLLFYHHFSNHKLCFCFFFVSCSL